MIKTMRIFFIILITLFFLGFKPLESIYDISFSTIDGEQKTIASYKGKRLLVLVLPGTIRDADTVFLNAINNTGKQYKQVLNIIAVPSLEDGLNTSKLNELKKWYKKYLDVSVVITAPMQTKKTSPNQHPLFAWLTHKDKNTHFDEDVVGAGHKYFISAQGELHGVYDPKAPLNEKVLNVVMNQ
jgi:glutathione peroxidase